MNFQTGSSGNTLLLDNAASNEPAESRYQLQDFFRIIQTRWRLIVGTVVVLMTLTLVVLFQLTPLYTAHSVVMLDQRRNNVEDVNAVLSGLPTDPTSVQNQVQILTSRNLAARVIDRLRLSQDPEFNQRLNGWQELLSALLPTTWFQHGVSTKDKDAISNDEKNEVIDRFEKHLSVAPIGLSTAIDIGVDTVDPGKSQVITNAVAEEYVEDQLNAKFEATQNATRWLSDRIQKLAQQVQTAEAAVQEYKAENNISLTADGSSVVDQQMGSVSAQLVLAKSDLAEKQANYGRVSSLVRSGRAADVSQVVSSPLIATLRGQETDLGRQEADLLTQFGPRHPKILQMESEKKNLEEKISEEVQRVVQTVASDVAVAQANVSSLEQSLTQMESKSQTQSMASVKLKALESAASSSRAMYEAYLGRLKETQGQEGIQTPDARIISTAELPDSPSFPKKLLTLGIVLPVSLILGFMLAYMVEGLDSGFRTSARVESELKLPVLGSIPEIESNAMNAEASAADQVIDKPMSSFAEAIRGLQLGLSLSNVDAQPNVIVVSSSVPGEGKTTIAVSLARHSARGEKKVIIVDGDLRRPMIAKTLKLPQSALDISDVLLGKCQLIDALVQDPKSNAKVLPCMKVPPSPADLLHSHAMEKLIRQLRESFDVVVIDSAPLLPVHDTKFLARLADAVLFVTRWEKTPREAARNALRSLDDVKAPIAGIALARVDATRFQYYNYGYQDYHSYHKYYQ